MNYFLLCSLITQWSSLKWLFWFLVPYISLFFNVGFGDLFWTFHWPCFLFLIDLYLCLGNLKAQPPLSVFIDWLSQGNVSNSQLKVVCLLPISVLGQWQKATCSISFFLDSQVILTVLALSVFQVRPGENPLHRKPKGRGCGIHFSFSLPWGGSHVL